MKSLNSTRTTFKLLLSSLLVLFVPLIVMAQPANNACTAPTTLISGTTCTATAGALRNATAAATATTGINAFCGNAGSPDVWYIFTAQSPYPVITLSGMAISMQASPRLQLFNTTSCTVATQNANSLACVSGTNVTTLSLNVGTDVGGVGLTVGTQYLVRVFTNGTTAVAPAANWNFNICVTDPVLPAPSNDECTGAVHLNVGSGCGSIAGTMINATNSGVAITPCTGPVTYDVWYKFVANNTSATITLGGGANNFTNRRMQLFSGTCGSLTPVPSGSGGCGTTTLSPTALVPGNTYYIRVYSTTAGAAPAVNAGFTMCVTTTTPPPRYGNSYVNISKKTNGGVVQTGDTLEIRMTINHTTGTLYKARYVANVPTNTAMVLTGGSAGISIITNEGLTFRKYTLAAGDDAGTYNASPPALQYNIRMNLGLGGTAPGTPANNTATETASATGQLIAAGATNKPRGGGGMLFAAAFRVVVTGNPGDVITLGTAKFIYHNVSSGGTDIELNSTPYQILISNPMDLCENSTGLNAAQESGGTFGSGTTTNRATDLANPMPGYTFVAMTSSQAVGDGQYAVVKNMSPRVSTVTNANKQPTCGAPPPTLDCDNRMFDGFWEIAGDHTGTTNAAGNPPSVAGATGGYMLMVNADFVASEAYRQTLTGLCPGTYYEFSAWVRNICTNCGRDSTDAATYVVGVYPNLTFALDGLDRYSTGEIDAVGWVKKGFVFLTGPAQTSVTFVIRNNSQGGGGNDWAMDDIGVRTCLPYMAYNPSANPNVCQFNATTVYDTVRSYFDNYVYYKWQRSTDGGTNWTDLMGVQGPASPTYNATHDAYEYLTHFVIPPAWASTANNGDLYRVIAATTSANLSTTNCVVTDGISFLTLNVLNCGTPLKTDILSFSGKLVTDIANLNWTTSKEEEPVKYEIERSTDGVNFVLAGVVNGFNNTTSASNEYVFADPVAVNGKAYYRIAVVASGKSKKYSRTIQLSKFADKSFSVTNVLNPFNQVLDFNVTLPADTRIEAELLDLFGKVVKKKSFAVHAGLNSLSMTDTEALPNGTYILRVRSGNEVISKKMMKQVRL
jgi:trimeric autotransporter adhesin